MEPSLRNRMELCWAECNCVGCLCKSLFLLHQNCHYEFRNLKWHHNSSRSLQIFGYLAQCENCWTVLLYCRGKGALAIYCWCLSDCKLYHLTSASKCTIGECTKEVAVYFAHSVQCELLVQEHVSLLCVIAPTESDGIWRACCWSRRNAY